jgi:hypothetical protein
MKIVNQASAQGKAERIEEMVAHLQGFIRRAAETRSAAPEVERELFKRLLQLGLLLLQQFFALLGDGDEGERVELSEGRELKRLSEPQRRGYRSIFGLLEIGRWVYARGEKQRIEYVPLDARAGLPAGKDSYLLLEWDQRLAVEMPYGQINAVLEPMLGLRQSVAHLEQTSRRLAAQVEGFWAKQSVPPVAGQSQIVVLSADGKGVPMRKAPEAAPISAHAHRPGPKPGRKQMALVGAAYHIEPYVRTPEQVLQALFQERVPGSQPASARPSPQHKRLRAALSEADIGQPGHSAEVIFPWLLEQAQERDPPHRQSWVVVMDGQPTLWEHLGSVLKDAPRVEILDLLHANGSLWQAVHLFHDPGSDQALALMKLCLLMLLKGKAQTLMSWLTDQAEQRRLSADQRQQLAKISGYFHRHRHRVHYDQYRAAGYPIASGVIEGACRHVVKDRMERAGMHWTLPGAQAMLQLRCIALNGQWEDFMEYYIAQETARLYPQGPSPQPNSDALPMAA